MLVDVKNRKRHDGEKKSGMVAMVKPESEFRRRQTNENSASRADGLVDWVADVGGSIFCMTF